MLVFWVWLPSSWAPPPYSTKCSTHVQHSGTSRSSIILNITVSREIRTRMGSSKALVRCTVGIVIQTLCCLGSRDTPITTPTASGHTRSWGSLKRHPTIHLSTPTPYIWWSFLKCGFISWTQELMLWEKKRLVKPHLANTTTLKTNWLPMTREWSW